MPQTWRPRDKLRQLLKPKNWIRVRPVCENPKGGRLRNGQILLQKTVAAKVEQWFRRFGSDQRRRLSMMGRLGQDQGKLFYSFCLDDAVPGDHRVGAIAAILDLSWVRAELAPHYSAIGRLRLRGPRGAQDEFTLAAIAQNLRRLAKLTAQPPPLVCVG